MAKKFRLFGEIISDDTQRWGIDDVTPAQFEAFLRSCPEGEDVEIEINSPGGSVTAGLAIANLIKAAKQNITCTIYGIAASMASVIACASKEVKAFKGSFLMVHNPWTVCMGNAEEMRKIADTLDSFRDALLSFYVGKFPGKDKEQIKELMDAETWIRGEDFPGIPFAATLIDSDPVDRMAACAGRVAFAKMPEAAKSLFVLRQQPKAQEDTPPPPPAAPPPAPEPVDPVVKLSSALESRDKQCRDFQSQRDQARAEVAKLQDSMAKLKNDFEAASAGSKKQVSELQARIERMTLNAFSTENDSGVATSWESALQECGGDYAKARKQYPGLYDAWMKEHSK